jgi:hypothetical protein
MRCEWRLNHGTGRSVLGLDRNRYAESFLGADHLRRILEEAQIIVNDALAASPQQQDN